MRTFDTGATRDSDETKPDYEGFLSPYAIEAFGDYMTVHRKQADGKLRASDNWQKGIPRDAYMKSIWRHFLQLWKWHRISTDPSIGERDLELEKEETTEALCALFFNIQGYLHEVVCDRSVSEEKHTADTKQKQRWEHWHESEGWVRQMDDGGRCLLELDALDGIAAAEDSMSVYTVRRVPK